MLTKIQQAVHLRRRRDAAAKRLDLILEISERHGQTVNGFQHELEQLVDSMSSAELKSYWKLCQE